jgi:2-dehydropantoate 2-reductase
MKFCIVGAGAIGGYLAARLAQAGEEVAVIARGATLAAIRARGIRVATAEGAETAVEVAAFADAESAGVFDVVLLALKAHQLPALAGSIGRLCRDDTTVVPMQNGIPFWYFQRHGGEHEGRVVESVDPGGLVKDAIPAARIVGCVVYVAAERPEPGLVVHSGGDRLPMGEIDGSSSERLVRIAAAFARAGLQCPPTGDIRAEVWTKLWGNSTFNPVSALTRASLSGICGDADGRALAEQMMRETQAVAQAWGIAFRVTLEQRIAGAARVGAHRTSMLQDLEAGRALEADALLGSVVEMGGIAGVATPALLAIHRATKLLDRTRREPAAQ